MKKIFFNSSPSLRVLGHFNLIVGLLVVFVFLISQTSQATTSGWNSTNKEVEVTSDVVMPTVDTIINTTGWNSENKATEAPAATVNNTLNTTTGSSTGWNSTNKEIQEPYGSTVVIGSDSSTTVKTTNSTTINIVQKQIPTIQVSTVKNDKEEDNKINNALKTGSTSTTRSSEVEVQKVLPQVPFSTPINDIGSQIQSTMNVINSLGTSSDKIIEIAYGVKSENVDLLYKDTNKDGISDYDSIYVYNIDPTKSSPTTVYEGKKINAGEKILLGFDPTSTSTVKINHEEPSVSSVKETSTYKVDEVALTKDKQVTLKGKALPNSFITLYIYSTPVIVTVKTDATGEWKYTLDKELEDGQHMIYTATVNNTGKILAKSAPFAFAKTAEAATLIPAVQQITNDMKPEVWNSKYTMMIIGFFILSILAVLFVVGVGIRKNPNQIEKIKQNDLPSPKI